jgi:hypothetical protein
MPLTPRFDIQQTSTHVIVTIQVPTIRVSNETIEVLLLEDFSQLHFYAAPYLLKLDFAPKRFQDSTGGIGDGSVLSAQYDPSEQTVTIPLMKTDINNFWPNLDLTARLMQPREIPKRWLHSVVDNSSKSGGGDGLPNEVNETNEREDSHNDENNDDDEIAHSDSDTDKVNRKTIGQLDDHSVTGRLPSLTSSVGAPISGAIYGYGFSNMFQSIFTDYCRSGLSSEMLQLKDDPGSTSPADRRTQRLAREKVDFDLDHYMLDLNLAENDDYMYQMVVAFVPWWVSDWRTSQYDRSQDETVDLANRVQSQLKLNTVADGAKIVSESSSGSKHGDSNSEHRSTTSKIFTADERLLLSTIPYPLLPRSLMSQTSNDGVISRSKLCCGILDVLMAYTYDHLFATGDATVESAWTIATLSTSLSWLDDTIHGSVEETLFAFVRRCLIYPYWRSIDFTLDIVVAHTLTLLLETGIPGVVKALLQIRQIFDTSEWYYVHNKIWVDPYLYWVQNQEDDDDDSMFVPIITDLKRLLEVGYRQELIESVGLRLKTNINGDDIDDYSLNNSSGAGSCSQDETDLDDDGDDEKTNEPEIVVDPFVGETKTSNEEHIAPSNPTLVSKFEAEANDVQPIRSSRAILEVESGTPVSPFLFPTCSTSTSNLDDMLRSSSSPEPESSPAPSKTLVMELYKGSFRS